MISDIMWERIDKIDVLRDRWWKRVRRHGVRSGSYIFGGWKPGHDIDVLIPPAAGLSWDTIMKANQGAYSPGEYRQQDFRSNYVKNKKGIVYNLLIFDHKDVWQAWVNATYVMEQMWHSNNKELTEAMSNKHCRVNLFESFVKHYKADLNYDVPF